MVKSMSKHLTWLFYYNCLLNFINILPPKKSIMSRLKHSALGSCNFRKTFDKKYGKFDLIRPQFLKHFSNFRKSRVLNQQVYSNMILDKIVKFCISKGKAKSKFAKKWNFEILQNLTKEINKKFEKPSFQVAMEVAMVYYKLNF